MNLFQGRYRWVVCSFLFLATTINYIDRQILSLLKPILDQEIGWTNTEFGLVNSAFQGAYALSLLFFGWLIDRYGVKIGYAASIFAWSMGAIGHALVNSVAGFFGARIALGLGEGGNFPAAIKAIASWFPPHERALAASLFNSGTNVGAIIAPAVVPWIAYAWGWHWAFVIAGLSGCLWLLIWIPFYHAPQESPYLSAEEKAHIESGDSSSDILSSPGWKQMLRFPQTWAFIVAKFCTDPIWWFFLIWLPDFFKRTRDLDIKHSWPLLVSIYTMITILSIGGGWLTGFLNRRGWSLGKSRKMGMFFFALLVIPLAWVTEVGDWPAVFLVGLAGAAHQSWSATLYTTVSDLFPKNAIATVVGMGGAAGSIGGMLFPIFVGYLLDKNNEGYTILFMFCPAAYLLSFGIHHLLTRKFEPVSWIEEK